MAGELVGIASLKALIQRKDIESRFRSMLGARAPMFFSSIVSAVSTNSKLAQADQMTVISSAAIAASLDLPINQSLGFAHIVPYGGMAQFQMGWKGFVQLAMRSGQYKTMNVAPYHEGDVVYHNRITGEMKFSDDSHDDAPVEGYVAYFKLLNGFEKYYPMTKKQVEAHGKRYSKSYNSEGGRWLNDFESMALKTVLKMLLSKYGILSVEMQKAIESDQAVIQNDGSPEYVDSNDNTDDESNQQQQNAAQPEQPTDQQTALPVDEAPAAGLAAAAKNGGKK